MTKITKTRADLIKTIVDGLNTLKTTADTVQGAYAKLVKSLKNADDAFQLVYEAYYGNEDGVKAPTKRKRKARLNNLLRTGTTQSTADKKAKAKSGPRTAAASVTADNTVVEQTLKSKGTPKRSRWTRARQALETKMLAIKTMDMSDTTRDALTAYQADFDNLMDEIFQVQG